jgi:hypothetical protein
MRILSIALLIPIAASCASKETSLPASPVPAVLTDLEAAAVADAYLATTSPQVGLRDVSSIEPTGDGYRVAFTTYFDAHPVAPKHSHLVSVKHAGTVREITFRRNQ